MNGNTQVENMKVYRPKGDYPWFYYVGTGICIISAVILGIQNIGLRKEINNRKEVVVSQTTEGTVGEKEGKPAPETITLSQADLTENWRIYKNLTYNYKFRVPKTFHAKVNNLRNSVEIFNEGSQKTIEIIAEPISNGDNNNPQNKITLGGILYEFEEFVEGNQTIKSPFALYKTAGDKYMFSLFFYNSAKLNEMEKLILGTFSPTL